MGHAKLGLDYLAISTYCVCSVISIINVVSAVMAVNATVILKEKQKNGSVSRDPQGQSNPAACWILLSYVSLADSERTG